MDMGASNGIYDADDGKFILTVEKVNKGEHFPNLDLISTLIVKRTKNFPSKPNIRILGKTSMLIYCLMFNNN
jgi:protein SHQ1